MIKKVIIVFSFTFLLQLLLISCCRDTFYQYYSIIDMQSSNCLFQNELQDSATVTQEEYRLKIQLSPAPYLKSSLSSLFINRAMALSCEEINVGLDSKIESFTISADQKIYNTKAGDPLAHSKFRINPSGIESKEAEITIDEWLENINNSGYIHDLMWYFHLDEPLLIDAYIRFTIDILLDNGTTFKSITPPVRILQ